MIRSLRMRLFLGTTLLSAVLFSILCATINTAVKRTLEAEFDRVLLEKARTIASLVEQSGNDIHFDYRRSLFPEFEPGENSDYFEILLDGKPFARSLSLEDGHLPFGAAPPPNPPAAATPATLPSGHPGRQITMAFQPLVEQDTPSNGLTHRAVLALSVRTAGLARTIAHIRFTVIFICAAATLLSGVSLLLIVGRAIAPVKVLASQIESVRIDAHARQTADNNSGPAHDKAPTTFITAPIPSELAPVVDRLNELFARLADAFARERSFTADAAHELRTPLAGLLTTLEVCRTRPRGSAEYESAIDKCLAMLTQMRGMTEKLLLLSRADAGQVTVRATPVDVASLVEDCWQNVEPAARSRGIHLNTQFPHSPPAPFASADSELLRVAVNNLLDNAISYARENSPVTVSLAARNGHLHLAVSNLGHTLSSEDLPKLFERFWRKDAARTGVGRHAGLGLSLCHRLITLQNGTITAQLENDHFTIDLQLPT